MSVTLRGFRYGTSIESDDVEDVETAKGLAEHWEEEGYAAPSAIAVDGEVALTRAAGSSVWRFAEKRKELGVRDRYRRR